jgi:mono/diheme cytochrome c family protein
MSFAMVFAADFRAIGLTVAVVVLAGFVLLFIRNSFQARPELGSEIELAANKKEYLSDEDLEGKKLDWSLGFALVTLGIVALSLPFYWLAEPGRQDGAVEAYQINFESRGEGVYLETAQCVNCHAAGGVGGVAAYVLQDQDGQFLANAAWVAPALNNVFLRYSEEEVTYILNYGRPGSPMAAWGTPGGGPLTTQQVQNAIEYIDTYTVQSLDPIAIAEAGGPANDDPESIAAQEAADKQSQAIIAEVERSVADGEFDSIGEAVFNLGYYSNYAAGSLSCARCHTAGWSLGPNVPHPGGDPLSEEVAGCGGGYPSGIGFNLCAGGVESRFPNDAWKLPDGTWAPEGGLADGDGFYYLAMDGTEVRLDDRGSPVTGQQNPDGTDEFYRILDSGDLADCASVSNLWEPADGEPYPFAIDHEFELDDSGEFIYPPELTEADLTGTVVRFNDGRLGDDCTVVDMPERTSYAQFNFIYNGANAGQGYGRGGLSAAGMMPGFGALLPPEYIQAVVDYERGL